MADADYYREQSVFCAHMSEVVREADDKSRWLKLAQQWRELEWRELAEHAEMRERPSPS